MYFKKLDKHNYSTLISVLWSLNVYKCLVSLVYVSSDSRAIEREEQRDRLKDMLIERHKTEETINRTCMTP